MCDFQLHVPLWVLRSWFHSPVAARSPAWLSGALMHPPHSTRTSELHPAPPSLLTVLQDPHLTPPTSGVASLWAGGRSSATRILSLHSCTPGTQNMSWSRWTGDGREPSTTSTCSSEPETAFRMETSSRGQWGSLDVVEQADDAVGEEVRQLPQSSGCTSAYWWMDV